MKKKKKMRGRFIRGGVGCFFSYFTLTKSIAPLRPSKLYDMIAEKTNKVD